MHWRINELDNILLIFLNDLERVNEFNEIIDEFDKNGYAMYLLDNIKADEYFSFDSLPNLVEIYKNEHGNVNKVVVLSNSRDLIFSWYRCYNSVVDDYLYFIDEDEKNYFIPSDRHFNFYYNLYEFNGIDKETVEGKIYLNINFSNYKKIIDFLVKENNFRFFNSLNDSYFQISKKNKKQLSKKYIFDGYEYLFGINNVSKYEKINMVKNFEREFVINEVFLKNAIKNHYIIPYLTVLFYKTEEQALTNFLLLLFKNLKETDKKVQKEVFDELFTYIRSEDVDFKEKIYISSLLVMIHGGDERLAEFIMDTLLEDEEYVEYHYHMLYNILFYKTNENLKLSNKAYIQMRKEMIKLGEFFKEQGKINIYKKENKDDKFRIAIHYDQLLSIQHAPTLLALKMAKNLKTYCKDCKVKIFVEDNFIVNSNELVFPYVYSSVAAFQCKGIHEEYLKGYNVEVYYSNPNKSKIERTKEIVDEINKFNPDVIYSTSDISPAREILYPYYPIVYQTHGGTNFSTLCDAYVLYGNSQKEKLLQINNDIKLMDENKIIINEPPRRLSKQIKKDYKKKDLGLKEDSFVMVTVGNRLNAEVSDEFVDLITSFINENNNVVWILVGPRDIPYIMDNYRDLINERKIIKIAYEEDLLSLYKICDVYINPVRDGGAGSVEIAMQAGVPVIVEKTSQDAVFVIGEKNCVGDSRKLYIRELNNLHKDENYRKYKSELMQNIIAGKKSWKDYTKDYIEIFDLAKIFFNKRGK